jgi:oligopeptide transport system substrate-binding protein
MTRTIRYPGRWLVLLAALALVAAACGDDAEDADPDDPDAADVDDDEVDDNGEPAAGGEFSMFISEPQFLVPQNSTEVMGSQVLATLFTGLVEYDPETAEILEAEGMAESIESDDPQNWTITIKDDYTFHNGEPVTAQSFVDAWNFMADPDNAMQNVTFMEIAGFEGLEAVQEGEAEEVSGIEAVDDTTIEVTLDEPFSPFEQMIGYTGFYPLPEEAFDDIEAFEDAPIGNGPYQMEGEWERGQQIEVTRYEDYAGEPGNADAVEFRIYEDNNTAYTDMQAGNLDIMNQVPPEQIQSAEQEFPDGFEENETSSFTYVGFPLYQEEFDDVNLRRAFSLAIDRESIIDAIFFGAQTPATAVIPPTLDAAYRDDACEYCEHDPDQAQELFEEAGGYEGTLTLYFNSGAGHEDWMEAVSNQLQETLDIEDVEFESLDFAEYLDLLDAEEVTGPFRLGWVLSYPSPQYAMQPLYSTDAASNNFGYSNEEFDQLLNEANQADDEDEAIELYQEAEDILLDDMPHIPMWYQVYNSVHSERVDNVTVDTRTFVRVKDVEVVE